MKLTTDLRRAITAAVHEHNSRAKLVQSEHQQIVDNWVKTNPKIKRLVKDYEDTRKCCSALYSKIENLGLSPHSLSISKPELLAEAGLKLPGVSYLNEDMLFARVARAQPKEGMKILRDELGIVWE